MNLLFALETLTSAGVLLEHALPEARGVLRNRALRRGLIEAQESLLQGTTAATAFADTGLFPDRLVRWLAVGERTGSVDQVFSGLSRYYKSEYEKLLGRLTSLIEPLLVLFVGGFLFAAVLVFVVPLFSWYGELL